jgi:large subunit ribosomal protein L4
MLEASYYTATAQKKGQFQLPAEFDGVVREGALYHAVRAYLNNQRQGTQSTKTRSEVSGGNAKPWRQKGTGRARQGSTRAPHWVGGGIALGPKPRSYQTNLPRKVRQLARKSALNARAASGAIHVVEEFSFTAPRTRQLVELLTAAGVADERVLVLTHETNTHLYLSGRNLQNVRVMRYRDASAYDILWASALVVEQAAIGGGTPTVGEDAAAAAPAARPRRKATTPKRATGRAAGKAKAKAAKPKASAAKPKATKPKATKPKATAKKSETKPKKKGGRDA